MTACGGQSSDAEPFLLEYFLFASLEELVWILLDLDSTCMV
jgi:hypothetical protein